MASDHTEPYETEIRPYHSLLVAPDKREQLHEAQENTMTVQHLIVKKPQNSHAQQSQPP